MGTGYVLRSCSEIFLLGKHGSPRTFSRSIRNVIEAPRREHSRKPDEAYAMAEELFGPARRADLFSRQARPGWEPWGNQTDHFPPGPPVQRPQSFTLDLCQEVAA
jgi:N6-adenosine-specific RNA methylase IME4